jgi:rRNA maturation protein Nop10
MFKQKTRQIQDCEKRREARYPLEVDAIIFCGHEFFITKTLNISTCGVQLANPVPKQFDGKKIIIEVASDLENPDQTQRFYGSPVDEFRNRIKFSNEVPA